MIKGTCALQVDNKKNTNKTANFAIAEEHPDRLLTSAILTASHVKEPGLELKPLRRLYALSRAEKALCRRLCSAPIKGVRFSLGFTRDGHMRVC